MSLTRTIPSFQKAYMTTMCIDALKKTQGFVVEKKSSQLSKAIRLVILLRDFDCQEVALTDQKFAAQVH